MASLGLAFTVHVADVDESERGEPPAALVARLSHDKASAVAGLYREAIVIGADTIVTLDGHSLGKPGGAAEAMAMLRRLRDRPHQVYSGVTVCTPEQGAQTAVVECTVWMRPYSESEMAAYVASGDPLDKAGAYGIQNIPFRPVSRLQGCYASVMGLPLCALVDLLSAAGLVPPVETARACSSVTGQPCCCGERTFVLNLDRTS